MTTANEVYVKVSERLGAPNSTRFVRVLEAMMTPEEGHLLLELAKPLTCPQLAEKLGVAEASLQAKLDDMTAKCLIRAVADNAGTKRYMAPPNIVMFHHQAHSMLPEEVKPKVYPLWEDFFFAEWRDILVDSFERRLDNGGARGHRVFPARKALDASPNIRPEQILPSEDMREMLRRGKTITTTACGCRVIWGKCDVPLHVCLHIDNDRIESLVGKRLDVRVLSLEEALTAMAEAGE